MTKKQKNEMTQEEIRNTFLKIDRQEERLAERLIKLQEICKHPDAVKKYDSNSGNYDPSADSYWIDFKCPDCSKWWREDQ